MKMTMKANGPVSVSISLSPLCLLTQPLPNIATGLARSAKHFNQCFQDCRLMDFIVRIHSYKLVICSKSIVKGILLQLHKQKDKSFAR